jgi:DNA-binding NtrC family response regulator
MPTISGLQLVRLARTLAAALPVVVMNGGMTMDEMRMYHTFPAITILPKPFSGDQLLAAVHKLLNGADVSMLNNWTGKTVHSESAKA